MPAPRCVRPFNACPARQFEVWVTHQVNITALTREVPAMGEGLVVDGQARVIARTLFV